MNIKASKFISILLTFALLIGCFSITASAAETASATVDTTVEYFDDGSYAIITVTTEAANAKATTKTGTKLYTYKNSDGETQWTYEVTGIFTYTGSSSTCTSVSDSYKISNSKWHMTSHSCSKNGNTASGTITMKYKLLGITTTTVSPTVTLACSATGVLS